MDHPIRKHWKSAVVIAAVGICALVAILILTPRLLPDFNKVPITRETVEGQAPVLLHLGEISGGWYDQDRNAGVYLTRRHNRSVGIDYKQLLVEAGYVQNQSLGDVQRYSRRIRTSHRSGLEEIFVYEHDDELRVGFIRHPLPEDISSHADGAHGDYVRDEMLPWLKGSTGTE